MRARARCRASASAASSSWAAVSGEMVRCHRRPACTPQRCKGLSSGWPGSALAAGPGRSSSMVGRWSGRGGGRRCRGGELVSTVASGRVKVRVPSAVSDRERNGPSDAGSRRAVRRRCGTHPGCRAGRRHAAPSRTAPRPAGRGHRRGPHAHRACATAAPVVRSRRPRGSHQGRARGATRRAAPTRVPPPGSRPDRGAPGTATPRHRGTRTRRPTPSRPGPRPPRPARRRSPRRTTTAPAPANGPTGRHAPPGAWRHDR